MKLFKLFISIITSVLLFANVSLAEKWDMALAYGAGNFHSANATEFAKNVTEKKVVENLQLLLTQVAHYLKVVKFSEL